MNVLNRPAIKAEARSFIGPEKRWLKLFVAAIISPALIYLIQYLLKKIIDPPMMSSYYYYSDAIWTLNDSIFYILYMICIFCIYPLMVSVFGFNLKGLRSGDLSLGNFFTIAKDNYGKFFVVMLLKSIFLALWTCLLFVPGLIKTYAYIMAEYIINDNPSLSAKEAITISNKMTKGFKWDIFVMHLSFIPWALLGGVTLGIGFIYVIPYMNITLAMYYENLKKHAIDNGIVSPQELGVSEVQELTV